MPDTPTLFELKALIDRNHADSREDIVDLKHQLAAVQVAITAQLDRFLLKDVYAAETAAFRDRVSRLEKEAEASRAAVRAAVYAAVTSVVASIVAGIIMAVLVKGR